MDYAQWQSLGELCRQVYQDAAEARAANEGGNAVVYLALVCPELRGHRDELLAAEPAAEQASELAWLFIRPKGGEGAEGGPGQATGRPNFGGLG